MISYKHLLAWRSVPGVDVVAVVDPDLGRAAGRAQEFGVPSHYASLEALLAAQTVDALDIASSRDSHAPLLRIAIERGIPAVCEKPLVPSVADARALIAQATGRTRIMANQNFRFRPYYRTMKQWIDDGTLGTLTGCNMACRSSGLLPDANGRFPYIERQPFARAEKRLMIEEVLVHRIDVARWLCGPLNVVAAVTRHSCREVSGESEATVLLATAAEGMPVVVEGNFASPGHPALSQDRVEIIGSRARLVMDDNVLRLFGPAPQEIGYDPAPAIQQSFDASMQHFMDCLQTGQPFLTSAEDNLHTLRLLEDAYRAAAQ
jgi:predicted dehydrogenase